MWIHRRERTERSFETVFLFVPKLEHTRQKINKIIYYAQLHYCSWLQPATGSRMVLPTTVDHIEIHGRKATPLTACFAFQEGHTRRCQTGNAQKAQCSRINQLSPSCSKASGRISDPWTFQQLSLYAAKPHWYSGLTRGRDGGSRPGLGHYIYSFSFLF